MPTVLCISWDMKTLKQRSVTYILQRKYWPLKIIFPMWIRFCLIWQDRQTKRDAKTHLFFYPRQRRFELPTPWSVAKCSIQLSYYRISTNIDYIISCFELQAFFSAGDRNRTGTALRAAGF